MNNRQYLNACGSLRHDDDEEEKSCENGVWERRERKERNWKREWEYFYGYKNLHNVLDIKPSRKQFALHISLDFQRTKKITWREWEREEIRFIVLLGQLLCIFIFCLDKVFIKKKKLCKNYFFCHEHEWECVCVLVCIRARYSFGVVYHLKKIEW